MIGTLHSYHHLVRPMIAAYPLTNAACPNYQYLAVCGSAFECFHQSPFQLDTYSPEFLRASDWWLEI